MQEQLSSNIRSSGKAQQISHFIHVLTVGTQHMKGQAKTQYSEHSISAANTAIEDLQA